MTVCSRAPGLGAHMGASGYQLAQHRHHDAGDRQPRPGPVDPGDPARPDPVAERPRDRQRLGVERPAVDPRAARTTSCAAAAVNSLKPQNTSFSGSDMTPRHSKMKPMLAARRRSGCWRSDLRVRSVARPGDDVAVADQLPPSPAATPATARSRHRTSAAGRRVASSIPRRTEKPLPLLCSLRSRRTRGSARKGWRRSTVSSSLALSTTMISNSPPRARQRFADRADDLGDLGGLVVDRDHHRDRRVAQHRHSLCRRPRRSRSR